MKKAYAGLAAVIVAVSGGTAHAQESTGFYLGAQAGIAEVSETDLVYYEDGGTFGGTGSTDTVEGTVDLDGSISFGGVIGYDFGIVRTDIEVQYAKNDIESLTINSVNGTAVTIDEDDADDLCDYLEVDSCAVSGNTISYDGGRIRQLSAMGNIWVDLPIGGTITPYAGGGLGVAGFETDGEGEAKFAWQLGAGVAINVSPSFALTLDYRHREVSETQIEYDADSGFEVGDIKTDTILAGLRVTL
jgi:opacity protein-like surface antigen